MPHSFGNPATCCQFICHSAEVAQIDGILRLAFAAVDHFVTDDIGENLFYEKVTIWTSYLPERKRGGFLA